ncbi:MAG: diaminopimelate epimerase [Athalassotoga sp.]|uniref:diaminopimelate epimerase n=1 Tax=Athalassotoga sp. TaxID=2022597 RepID=UPI003D01CFC1
MEISYYTATGNSFVMYDSVGKTLTYEEKSDLVLKNVGDRDGMIFVEKKDKFFMDYFNRDGQRAEFCGNGARSFVKYLHDAGYIKENVLFDSFAGQVEGHLVDGEIMIKMPKIRTDDKLGSVAGHYVVVGVPHYVIFVDDVKNVDVKKLGFRLRNELDANIDFVEIKDHEIEMRTYERGVESETKACGTGATASAYVSRITQRWHVQKINVSVPGGNLKVIFKGKDVYLQGGVDNV